MKGRSIGIWEVLFAIAFIVVFVVVVLPAIEVMREDRRRMSCQNNLKQLGTMLAMYASESAGERLPRLQGDPPWGPLNTPPGCIGGPAVLWDEIGGNASMHQFNHMPGGCNVLYLDGHVGFVRYPDAFPCSQPWATVTGTASMFLPGV